MTAKAQMRPVTLAKPVRSINRVEAILTNADTRLPADSPIFNFVQNVRDGCLQIISVMPDMTHEQLKAVHAHSAELESYGWLVRAYARHEFMKRAARLRGGRSLRDTDEIGRMAMAKKLADELDISHITIIEDALIIERLIEGEDEETGEAATESGTAPERTENDSGARTVSLTKLAELEIIPEKEYWRIAARSETPRATLASFAEQKAVNPFFNTRDAYRQEKEKKAAPIDEIVPLLIEDEAIKRWYNDFARLMQASPTEELRRIMSGADEEIRYEVQRPNGTRCGQLLGLIHRGVDELDLMANTIRQDRIHVGVWLNRMQEAGLILHFEKERPPNARGAARTGYRLTEAGQAELKKTQKGNKMPC